MRSRVYSLAALSLALLLTGGCTDDAAQASISQLKSDNQKLQDKVVLLEKRLEAVHTSTNFDEVIEQKVNARLKKIEEDQRTNGDANTKTITDFVDSSRTSIEDMKATIRQQMGDKDNSGFIEEHLKNQITAQAEIERAERQKLKEDILRHIDSQLKDIYPFAFKKQRTNEPRKQYDPVDMIP